MKKLLFICAISLISIGFSIARTGLASTVVDAKANTITPTEFPKVVCNRCDGKGYLYWIASKPKCDKCDGTGKR